MTNKQFHMAIISTILILGFAFLYGCGSNPSGGGESSGANSGTITGVVYDYFEPTKTFVTTTDVTVSVSTSDGINIKSATVDALGAFSISGLPSGTIMVTFTQEGAVPVSIVANSSVFKPYMNVIFEYPTGTATVYGSFESPSVTPTFIYI